MGDGEINRNGATIRIDDDGGVQVEPAEGQEVEYTGPDRGTDAIRDSVNTEQIGSERHFAGAFGGSSPDDRLGNALSASSNGDVIYLENADYTTNRTFTTPITLVGTASGFRGTALDATWTFDDYAGVRNVSQSGSIVLTFIASVVESCTGPNVTAQSNQCRVVNCSSVSVTFESGTENGVADALANSTVTDNGTNTVGDVS